MSESYTPPPSEVVKEIGVRIIAALDPDASLEERAMHVAWAVAVSPIGTAVMLTSAAAGMNQALIKADVLSAEDIRGMYRSALKAAVAAVSNADPVTWP